jgi:hypothetical protein
MGKPTIDEDIERSAENQAEGHSNGKDADINATAPKVYALHHVANTNREKIAEMSDIPPDLFRSLSVLRIHIDDVLSMCEEILTAQKIWQRNWEYYNIPTKETMAKLKELISKNGRITIGTIVSKKIEEYTDIELAKKMLKENCKFKYAEFKTPKRTIRTTNFKAIDKLSSRFELVVIKLLNPNHEETAYRSAKDELNRLMGIFEEKKHIDTVIAKWRTFVDELKQHKVRLAADNFEFYYLQRRRSKEGNLLSRFMDAGQDQIAAEGASNSVEDLMQRAQGEDNS